MDLNPRKSLRRLEAIGRCQAVRRRKIQSQLANSGRLLTELYAKEALLRESIEGLQAVSEQALCREVRRSSAGALQRVSESREFSWRLCVEASLRLSGLEESIASEKSIFAAHHQSLKRNDLGEEVRLQGLRRLQSVVLAVCESSAQSDRSGD